MLLSFCKLGNLYMPAFNILVIKTGYLNITISGFVQIMLSKFQKIVYP